MSGWQGLHPGPCSSLRRDRLSRAHAKKFRQARIQVTYANASSWSLPPPEERGFGV
jgi:hypothetical protein